MTPSRQGSPPRGAGEGVRGGDPFVIIMPVEGIWDLGEKAREPAREPAPEPAFRGRHSIFSHEDKAGAGIDH